MSKIRTESVVFYSALGLSVVIHVWFLALWMIMQIPHVQAAKKQTQTNITYFSKSSKVSSEPVLGKKRSTDFQSSQRETKENRDLDKSTSHDAKPHAVMMEPDFLGATAVAADKMQQRLPSANTDKRPTKIELQKISIPMITSSGAVRPEHYPEYFNEIGEKIRKKAYEMVKRSSRLSGEFYLSFVLKPDGRVMNVHVFTDKPDPGHQLSDLVADIVRAASPFETFPKEMGRQDISCDVAIEFR